MVGVTISPGSARHRIRPDMEQHCDRQCRDEHDDAHYLKQVLP